MGNSLACCSESAKPQVEAMVDEQVESPVSPHVDTLQQRALEAAESTKERFAETADAVKDKATDAVEAVGDAIENVAERAAEAAGLVKDDAEKVEGTANTVADFATDAAKVVVDAIDATMDAAIAAVTNTMIVDFAGEKGPEQQVTFKTRMVGLELGMSGGGCCAPKGSAKVVVKKLQKGGQADVLGVKLGWKIKSVNGVDVTGLQQAKKMLDEQSVKLPVA